MIIWKTKNTTLSEQFQNLKSWKQRENRYPNTHIDYRLFSGWYTGVQHNIHSRWHSCGLTVTGWVSHMEQELLTLPGHMSSPRFVVGPWCSIFSCLWNILYFIVCPFVLFLLVIVLSVLRFTASDYLFDIFKPFMVLGLQYKMAGFN